MTWRDEFPVDDGIAYLNHAAIGVWPRRTRDAVVAFADENMRRGAAEYPRWLAVERMLRARLATLIGANPDDIALVGSTSDALSIVAQGLDWRAGDAVVIPAGEFPSNRIVWEALAGRGVTVREVDISGGEPESALIAACDARTRLMSVSSVQYASGLRLDLERLGAHCRKQGIVCCVDAIQSLGAMRLDVRACHADVVAADAHKWMLGPEGLALLFVRKGLRQRLQLLRHGWHMVARAGDFEAHEWRPADSGRRFEPGSPNMTGIHALNASLSLLLEIGMEQVERGVLDRARRLMRLLGQTGRFALLTPEEEGRFAGIVTARRVDLDADGHAALQRHLMARGVICAMRGGGIRFSPHFHTPGAALEKAVETAMRFRR